MTETTKEQEKAPVQPQDFLKVTYKLPGDDKRAEHEILMSAGLIRRISSVVGMENLGQFYTDSALQSFILQEVCMPMSERDKNVNDRVDLDHYDLRISEAEKVISWVEDHLLYFFTIQALRVKQSAEKGKMEELTSLLNGLQGLAKQMQSAGLSKPSQAD